MTDVRVTVETRLVDVDSKPVEVRVEHAPVRTVKVATAGPRGPVGPVADLDLVLSKVDEAVQDYFVLHPQTFTYYQPDPVETTTIVHPLDHRPTVTVTDTAGDEHDVDVAWPTFNTIVVTATPPFAFFATLT